MSAKMIAEEGTLAGLVVSLGEGKEWILGKGPDATILIADPLTGDRHVRLSLVDDGIQVEPLDENSVQVNDEEVLTPHLLHHGDVLKIGGNRFRFYREIGNTGLAEQESADLNAGVSRPPQEQVGHPPKPLLEPNEPVVTPDQPLEEPKGKTSGDVLDNASKEKPLNDVNNELEAPKLEQEQQKSEEEKSQEETSKEEKSEKESEAPSSEDLLSNIDFGIDDAGPFLLKVIRGPNNGAEFSMEPGHSYVLGTDPQLCDVVFHDMSISRQHARVTIAPDLSISLEDLGSRNGTSVDETKITEKVPLAEHVIVMLGTTSFIIFNRESERSTIITPFLPSIVRSLHDGKESEKKEGTAPVALTPPAEPAPVEIPLNIPPPHPRMSKTKKYILVGLTAGFLTFFALGTSSLFRTTTFVPPSHNTTEEIAKALKPFPNLQYSYNKESKRLFLVGHVQNVGDRTQLMYSLEALPFVRTVDDENLVIDEYVLKEMNQILNRDPAWSGVTIRSVSPGRFIISGYLKKIKDFNSLKDFLAQNFRYLDRLDNRVVVEEAEIVGMRQLIDQAGLHHVTLEMNNGEVTLEGSIPPEREGELDKIIDQIKKQHSVQLVKNFVTLNVETPEQPYIDLTSTYRVTGSASVGGQNVSVFINGRILSPGDILDGMTITAIHRNSIFLEKNGVQYRIEYNK